MKMRMRVVEWFDRTGVLLHDGDVALGDVWQTHYCDGNKKVQREAEMQ